MSPGNLFISLLTLLIATFGHAQPLPAADFSNRIVLTDQRGEYALGRHLLILEDPSRTLTIEDVRLAAQASDASPISFTPSTKNIPSFGFNASAFWVRIDIDRRSHRQQGWMLEFSYAPMQWIDVYTVSQKGEVIHQRGGMSVPLSERPYSYHKHVFELSLPPDQVTQLFVRLDGENSKNIALRLFRSDMFAKSASRELAMLSLYGGIILALLCYNLFIFITLREAAYVFYIGFLAASMLFFSSLYGVSQILLFPEKPYIGAKLIPFSLCLFDGLMALFIQNFLSTRQISKTLHHAWTMFFILAALGSMMPWLINYRTAMMFSAALSALGALFAVFTGVVALRRGNRAASYYLAAWLLLVAGGVLQSLRAFGLVPTNTFTEYLMLWGSAAEAILLSIALAARMRIIKDEKERAQHESMLNKQIALDTVQRYSSKLETEVKARTAELIETQQKLIATEKMAALGVFTAGMAHEINNPANFVSVGAQNTKAHIGEFRQFVKDLLSDEPDPDISEAFASRFQMLENANQIVFEGISRIEKVVKQLRAEHPEGDAGMQPVDVVSCLESAWSVFSPTLKIPVTLTTVWNSRPSVEGSVADLQQVFIALLSNAAHAIEDAQAEYGHAHEGKITLTSDTMHDQLRITVHDNGIGMPADRLDKIFDPFFTTKVVGRGAGLGLSMARDVVKKHHGSLEVISTPGQGSMFRVVLPLASSTEGT